MASKNAFSVLFAEREDLYFTDHLLMLDLHQYLYYQLKKRKFEEIYFIEAINGEDIKVFCENRSSGELFRTRVPHAFWELIPEFSAMKVNERTRYGAVLRRTHIQGAIEKLVTDKKEDRYGFVFLQNAFPTIYRGEEEINALEALLNTKRAKSLFLHVAKPDYKGELPLFPACIISKELQRQINSNAGGELLYERLQRQGNILTVYWETFYRKQVERLIQRAKLERLEIPVHLEEQLQALSELQDSFAWEENWRSLGKNKKELYEKVRDRKILIEGID